MAEEEEFTGSSYTLDYGPSKDKIFYVFVVYVTALIVGIIYVIWRLKGYNKPDVSLKQILEKEALKQKTEGKRKTDKIPDDTKNAQGTTRRRTVESRMQKDGRSKRNTNGIDDHEDSVEDDLEHQEELDRTQGKIGAKKLKKLQEKEERKAMREEMELERQERKERQEQRERLRQLEEERQREIEKEKEEEERLAKEKREQEEHERYLELKKEFDLTEEGQDQIEDEELLSNKLEEFINYLKDQKVVLLEDLASHFGLRTQDAIERVQELLKQETITGVIDDRGKFIYISQQELEEVANFVKRRGRVSIQEIAAASNRLINFAP